MRTKTPHVFLSHPMISQDSTSEINQCLEAACNSTRAASVCLGGGRTQAHQHGEAGSWMLPDASTMPMRRIRTPTQTRWRAQLVPRVR